MSHTFTSLNYHLIFATKGREPLLGKGARGTLFTHVKAILIEQGAAPLAVNGMPDHLHVLARLKPSHSVSDILRAVKSESSGRLKKRPGLEGFAWQRGYGAFTVSRSNLDAVRAYIEDQEEHHKATTLHDEMVSFLGKHDIEFDESSLWE